MTAREDGGGSRFARREPPVAPGEDSGVAGESHQSERIRANFLDQLDDIGSYLAAAREHGRAGFAPRTATYAAASLAIIRSAALFENDDFAPFLAHVPTAARRGIVTTRNIVAAGYASMDDDVFWLTIEARLPAFVDELRRRAAPAS